MLDIQSMHGEQTERRYSLPAQVAENFNTRPPPTMYVYETQSQDRYPNASPSYTLFDMHTTLLMLQIKNLCKNIYSLKQQDESAHNLVLQHISA